MLTLELTILKSEVIFELFLTVYNELYSDKSYKAAETIKFIIQLQNLSDAYKLKTGNSLMAWHNLVEI